MISKIIHYCRFGRGPKSDWDKVYIVARKKCLADYELRKWNENTFDSNPFMKQAHEQKKTLARRRFTYQKGFTCLTAALLHGPIKNFEKIYEDRSIFSLSSGFESHSGSDSMRKWANLFEELEELVAAL